MSFTGPGGSKESIPVIMQGGSSSPPNKSGGGKLVSILILVVVVIAATVIIYQQLNKTKKPVRGGEQVATTTSQSDTKATSTPVTTPDASTANSSESVGITDLPILDVDGKTLIGLRAVLEADGWLVDWSNASGEARCEKDGQQSISLKPGLQSIQVGTSSKTIDVVPVMRDNHILVSLVLLNELTDSRLSFDPSAKKATINK